MFPEATAISLSPRPPTEEQTSPAAEPASCQLLGASLVSPATPHLERSEGRSETFPFSGTSRRAPPSQAQNAARRTSGNRVDLFAAVVSVIVCRQPLSEGGSLLAIALQMCDRHPG